VSNGQAFPRPPSANRSTPVTPMVQIGPGRGDEQRVGFQVAARLAGDHLPSAAGNRKGSQSQEQRSAVDLDDPCLLFAPSVHSSICDA
jgi:hypothetical protein